MESYVKRQKTTKRVSVLIPVYNAAKFLPETIRSVLDQHYPDIELVLVDDGSTDHSFAVMKQYESERIRVLAQPNRGAGAARNRAFAASTGDYIQYLDADDLLHPEKIAAQIKLLEQFAHPEHCVTTGKWERFGGDDRDNTHERANVWHDYENPVHIITDYYRAGTFMPIHSWLTPRALIERSGGWDESLSLNDDGEFFARILGLSRRILFCESALCYYRDTPNSVSKTITRKAFLSWIKTMKSVTEIILEKEDTLASRQIIVDVMLRFMVGIYPHFPKERKELETYIRNLCPQINVDYSGVKRSVIIYYYMEYILGKRLTKKLYDFVKSHRLL